NLAKATPKLSDVFVTLNHFVNMVGYNPGDVEHGYLWWLAWLNHNARTLFSVQDANGDFRPLFLQASCATFAQLVNGTPAAAAVRIAGVSVGKVIPKPLDPQGNRTIATIQLDNQYAPLRKDARAILRTKTIIGETYVEITPGSPSAPPIPDGGLLSRSQVQ